MTPAELTEIRERLGLRPAAMARAMGVSYSTYGNWQAGRTTIPPVAARCAELLTMITRRALLELATG